MNPKDAWNYYHRGICYRNLGQHEKSIEDHSKAIELDPDNAHAYYNRGLSYRELGEHEKAKADHIKADELHKKIPF